jgi:hypothetical protein
LNDTATAQMANKLTAIEGPDREKIYIQYDEEESDELQGVGYIDDIQARTERFKSTMVSTVKGYSKIVLDTVQKSMADLRTPSKVTMEFGLQAGG